MPEVAEKTEHCKTEVVERVREMDANVVDGPFTTKTASDDAVVSADTVLLKVSALAFSVNVIVLRMKDVVVVSARWILTLLRRVMIRLPVA